MTEIQAIALLHARMNAYCAAHKADCLYCPMRMYCFSPPVTRNEEKEIISHAILYLEQDAATEAILKEQRTFTMQKK